MEKPTETLSKKELELYCKRKGVPTEWFIEINNILISCGFSNYHLREGHAVPEILDFIKKTRR